MGALQKQRAESQRMRGSRVLSQVFASSFPRALIRARKRIRLNIGIAIRLTFFLNIVMIASRISRLLVTGLARRNWKNWTRSTKPRRKARHPRRGPRPSSTDPSSLAVSRPPCRQSRTRPRHRRGGRQARNGPPPPRARRSKWPGTSGT